MQAKYYGAAQKIMIILGDPKDRNFVIQKGNADSH